MALLSLGRSFKCRAGIKRVLTATQSYCSSVVTDRMHINGVDLHYELRGRGKHALLFFPGALGGVHSDFKPQRELLNKERFTLVTWDPRGYGKSRPPVRDFPPDFFERDAQDGVDLMKALGFDKFSLLGWSAGGITALFAAAKNPDLIKQMVVWGAVATVSQEDIKIHNGMRDLSKWNAEIKKPGDEAYGAEGHSKIWGEWVDGILQFAERPGGNICLELLPLIRCPTLIVHGGNDAYVSFTHTYSLLTHIKKSQLRLVPEGKHSLHLKYADEFNKMVEDFLKD